jgi:hypothetical protein
MALDLQLVQAKRVPTFFPRALAVKVFMVWDLMARGEAPTGCSSKGKQPHRVGIAQRGKKGL